MYGLKIQDIFFGGIAIFKKLFVKKIWFYVQKYEKNWKSKNDLKSPLRALNKELWAI